MNPPFEITLTLGDWIVVATVAASLLAHFLTGLSAHLTARHSDALARIAGMAGREAASIARALHAQPPDVDLPRLERSLVSTASRDIALEMAHSVAVTGGNGVHVARIVQGELDKILTAAPAATAVAIAPPASPA